MGKSDPDDPDAEVEAELVRQRSSGIVRPGNRSSRAAQPDGRYEIQQREEPTGVAPHRVARSPYKIMNKTTALLILLVAAILEAAGDALVRAGLHQNKPAARGLLMAAGALVLFAYGYTVN